MNRTAWLLLTLALVARLVLASLAPLSDESGVIPYFNDERAHLNYIRYLAKTGKLPVQTSSVKDGFEKAEYEYYQPPLYYYLTHPFYTLGRRLTPGHELLWVRSISVLFSLGGLIILYLAVRSLIPEGRLAIRVLFLAAFGGVPLRFGSVVTNDSLLFAISCLYFALVLQVLSSKCDFRLFLAGILIAVAGLWTKVSFLLLLPLLPFVLMSRPNRSVWKAVLSFVIPLVSILPWYLRNHHLYGRFMPLQVGFGAADPLSAQNLFQRLFSTANYFVRSLVFPYDGLWGGALDKVIYPFEGLLFLALMVAGFLALRRLKSEWVTVFLAAFSLNLCGYLIFNVRYFQAEARLLIPSLPFLLTLLAIGAGRIAGKKKSRVFILLGLWMALPWLGALL